MAKNTKTAKKAKAPSLPATMRPSELATRIGVDAKVLRNHLRRNYPRAAEAKNTSWVIPAKVATEVIAAFEKNRAS